MNRPPSHAPIPSSPIPPSLHPPISPWHGTISFDRVLLDGPCSALGLRPRLFAANVSLGELRKNAVYQRRLIDAAVRLVKPGGTLVYSTCSINPGENEANVRYALDTYPHLSLLAPPPELHLGQPGLVGGLTVSDGTACKEWLREGEQHKVMSFHPSHTLDTIGFFLAKFVTSPTACSCCPH
ncbi:unnamed protein product [Closterium sp. Yama58-4]|nr:unnamed protein product [Closterium sp. Yama58-4]